MKILFTGGGTAGHILPIIAIARELRKIHRPEYLNLFYIGPKDDFVETLLLKEGIRVKRVTAGKVRRYFGIKSFFQNIFDVIKVPFGIIQAFFYIFFLNPDLIFSKGGFGSIPAVISGKILWVPIFMHESDIVPGLANRIGGKFALEIFVSFPIEKTPFFPSKKMIFVGNPIRSEILEGSKQEAQKIFNLSGKKPIILIVGGSQGAQRINDLFLLILPDLLKDFEIIHQTGIKNYQEVRAEAEVVASRELLQDYHPVPFLQENELKNAYKVCDLFVGRAGSSSIFEIAAVGRPSILIPLPEAAQNHQVKNAYEFAENGACLVVEESNLTPHFFLEKIRYLFSEPQQLEKMVKACQEFAKPQAGRITAEYILEYLKK